MRRGTLAVGGRKIALHVVRDGHPKLEGNNGMYYPDEGAIYLNGQLEATAFQDTYLHELEHAINDVSGANNVLAAAIAEEKKRDEAEEQIVRCRTTVWHKYLLDYGPFPSFLTRIQ